MMLPKMKPEGKFILKIRLILLLVCFLVVAFGFFVRGEYDDKTQMQHERKLQDLSIVNALDGPRCGAESHLKQYGLLLWVALIVYLFVGLAIVCDDYFVPSLEVVAEKWNLTEDVAGATLMAAGTSSTQLFAALIGVFFFPDDDSGPGTIVGSVVFNICVIIGATMIVTEVKYGRVAVDWYPLTRDSVFNILCLYCLYFVENYPSPGEVQWYGGAILLVLYAIYVIVLAFHANVIEYLEKKGWWEPFWYTDYDKTLIADKEEAEEADKALDNDFTRLNGRDSITMVRNPSLGSNSAKNQPIYPSNLAGSHASSRQGSSVTGGGGGAITNLTQGDSKRGSTGSVTWGPQVEFKQSSKKRVDSEFSAYSNLSPVFKPHAGTMTSKRSHSTMMTGISKSLVNWEEQQQPETTCGYITYALLWPWQVAFRYTTPNVKEDKWKDWYWPAFGMCILWLAIITFFVVDIAAKIGTCLGLSANVTGLTILAIGASLPDGLSSMIAARDNKCQMAICNAFGSNLFDILIGLGLPWVLSTGVNGMPVGVSVHSITQFLLATAAQIIFTVMILLNKLCVSKLQGMILLTVYGAFVIYVVIQND